MSYAISIGMDNRSNKIKIDSQWITEQLEGRRIMELSPIERRALVSAIMQLYHERRG